MTILLIWWLSRLERERLMLALAGVVMVLACCLQLWQMAVAYRDASHSLLAREQLALAALPQLETALAERLQRPASAPADLKQLNALAKELNLPLSLAQKADGFGLTAPVVVEFQPLLNWLATLDSRWQLHAQTLEIERTKQQVWLKELELRDER